ncbi:hypothetical protein [Tenacibaculum singaporense]|uniref:hypothetical protein n=1 Tax=Tenacibaculum singaporense TaxID=2358479 RepID=UPI003515B9AA
MKKRLFILLLFYSFLGYGQEYALWLSTRDYLKGEISDEFYNSKVSDVSGGENYNLISGIYNYKEGVLPLGISISQSWNYSLGVLCSFGKKLNINKYEYFVAGYDADFELCIKIASKNPTDVSKFYFFSIIVPNYNQPIDNKRSKDDLLFKTAENTFSDSVVDIPEIIWQYNYDNKGFKDFPSSIKNSFPMKATIEEILVNEGVISVNKTLKVKAILDNSNLNVIDINSTPSNTKLPKISTDIFNFNIVSSSPELKQKPPVSQNPSCNYRVDGSLTLDFKRDLYTTEKLAVIIYQRNTDSGKYDIILDQELKIESLEKIDETTYRYQWANNLPHGTYKLKYQTGEKGIAINPNDISWSSLVPVEFTIEETAKVDFQVTGSADQNCFEVNDGYIDISATGEGGRTFLYQLKKDNVIQIFNGTNWVNYTGSSADNETWFPFTNAKTTRISNLNKGAYSVKVKDSEECLAKQL